jgi:hypothetical protein
LLTLTAPGLFSAVVTWEGNTDDKWSDGSNWSFPGIVPQNGDDVIIPDVTGIGNPQPVMDVPSANLASVTIQQDATLDLNGQVLTTASLQIDDGALPANNGVLLRDGTVGESSPTDTDSGTIRYKNAGGGTIQEYGATDYNLLEINGGAALTPYSLTADLGTADNMTILNLAHLDAGANDVSVGGSFDIANGGFLYRDGAGENVAQDNNSGTVIYDAAAGGTVEDYGAGNDYFNLEIDGGAALTPYTLGAALGTANNLTVKNGAHLDVAGNSVTVTGAFDTENGGFLYRAGSGESVPQDNDSGTVVYNAAAGGTVEDYGAGNDYWDLEIEGGLPGSRYLLGAALNTGNDLTVKNGGYLDVQGNTVTVTGTFDTENGGFLYRAGSGESVPQDNNSGKVVYYTVVGGTVEDYGAGNDYWDLDITGGALAAAYTTGADLDVANNMTVVSGAHLDVLGNNLTVTGAFDTQDGGYLYRTGAIGQSVANDSDSGTVVYRGAAVGDIEAYAGADYYNLNINEAGATFSLTADIEVNGNLTISSGELDAAGFNIDLSGNWDNNDTFTPGVGNTITFNAAAGGPYTIESGGIGVGKAFGEIEFACGGVVTYKLITNPIEVNGDLTITSGRLDANGWDITIAGNWTNSAEFVSGATNTVVFDGNVLQTLDAGGRDDDLKDFNNVQVFNFATVLQIVNTDCEIDGLLTLLFGADFDLNGRNLDLGGDLSIPAGSNWTSGGGTVKFEGVLNVSDGNAVPQNLGNVIIDADPVTQLSSIQTTSLTINLGQELDSAGSDLYVSGSWANSGTYTSGGNRVTFNASAGPVTIDTGGVAAGQDFDAVEIDDGGAAVTFQLINNAIDINGNLDITNGTLDANGQNINLAGNWTNSGEYVSGVNTVTFNGGVLQTVDAGG